MHSEDTRPWKNPKDIRTLTAFLMEAHKKPKRIILLSLAINSRIFALSLWTNLYCPLKWAPKGRWKTQAKLNLITIDDDGAIVVLLFLPNFLLPPANILYKNFNITTRPPSILTSLFLMVICWNFIYFSCNSPSHSFATFVYSTDSIEYANKFFEKSPSYSM